jgi:GNAT superfamily N-acetyltransferase
MENKTTYKTTDQPNELGTLDRWLIDQDGLEVCKAEIMLDKDGNAVVIQLDTPAEHRGKGYARQMLELIGTQDTDKELRVISTEPALGYYRKLRYTEIAPHIFATTFN